MSTTVALIVGDDWRTDKYKCDSYFVNECVKYVMDALDKWRGGCVALDFDRRHDTLAVEVTDFEMFDFKLPEEELEESLAAQVAELEKRGYR